MRALGEQDFSTLPILILPAQAVKLMIQAVKNLHASIEILTVYY